MMRIMRWLWSIANCIIWEGQHDLRPRGQYISGWQRFVCDRCGRSFVR